MENQAFPTPARILGRRYWLIDGRLLPRISGAEGEGGDGGGDGGGHGGDGGSGGNGGNGGQAASLEAEARAAIDALKAAGAEIPAALTKAVDELAQARKDAGRYRTDRNDLATKMSNLEGQFAKIAEKLGITDTSDPEKVAQAATEERDRLAEENRTLKMEKALAAAAKTKGADAGALTDSRSFMDTVGKLKLDDEKFTEALEAAVEQAVKDNPKLKATQAVGKSGPELNGNGTNGDQPKTLADAVTAHYS